MNEKEITIVKKIIEEMKNSHAIIELWLKGTPIEATLARWIRNLEGLLK